MLRGCAGDRPCDATVPLVDLVVVTRQEVASLSHLTVYFELLHEHPANQWINRIYTGKCH